MQVRFPGSARDFLPRVNFQCRHSLGVHTPLRAMACINICVHDKDPVVPVRVQWIMATQTYPACTISNENNQLDDCGHSTESGRRRRTDGMLWTANCIQPCCGGESNTAGICLRTSTCQRNILHSASAGYRNVCF